MYLKKKFILLIAVLTFIGFLGCETPTNHQNETTTYNKSIKLDNKNINNNSLSSQILNEEKDTAQREFLNIVLMLPLSGKHYQIGKSLLNSAQLAVEKKNNKKIVFTIIDTGDEEQLLSQLYSVLEDDIDIIIGPVFSDKVNQVREVTKNKDIPIVAFSNNSKIQDNRLYVFGLKLEDEIKELLTYSIKRNLKKYAVLVPRNEFGSRVEKEIKQFQSKNNLSTFIFTFYNPNSPDFYEVSKNVSKDKVIDSGKIELGLQRHGYHEYFLEGKMYSGKIHFRVVKIMEEDKWIVFTGYKEEPTDKDSDEGLWDITEDKYINISFSDK